MKYLKLFFKSLAVLLIVFCVYLIYGWNASAKEVREICGSITMDMPYTDVQALVSKSRFARINAPFEYDGLTISMIHSPSSFGRYTCVLRIDKDLVKNVEFIHSD